MLKKALIAVLVVAATAASVFGVCAYRFNNSLKPEITEENLSKNATVSDNAKGLKSSMPFSCWKANEGDSAEIDFGREVTFNTVTLKESGDNIRFSVCICSMEQTGKCFMSRTELMAIVCAPLS